MLVALRGNMTLVLAMGTLLPLLLPLQCTLGIISCCVASCCVYLTVFFSQDLGDDAFASLGTSCSVSENRFECVPRSWQLDPNCASKKSVHDGEADIYKLVCDRHNICDLWFYGVQVVEGDGK